MLANLRPSGAHLWVNCPGSVSMQTGQPQGDTSAADEGTVAHWLAQKIFALGDNITSSFLGNQYVVDNGKVACVETGIEVTQDMIDYVMQYVNAVRAFGVPDVEKHVNLDGLLGKGAGGTCDAYTESYVVETGLELQVHDLKYGFNAIEAKDNLQLLCYAWGLNQKHGHCYETIRLCIHQPRIDRLEQCVYTMPEIETLWAKIKESADKVHSGCKDLKPGEHCSKYYCKARAICPALNDSVMRAVNTNLELASLADSYAKLDMVAGWLKAVEERIHLEMVVNGNKIPGLKVVKSREGNRKWVDEKEAQELLLSIFDDGVVFKKSLVSPTDIDKMRKANLTDRWDDIEKLVTRSPGKPIVVPESDKREELIEERLI